MISDKQHNEEMQTWIVKHDKLAHRLQAIENVCKMYLDGVLSAKECTDNICLTLFPTV